jgi:predicted dehydrogenase
MHDVRFGIVGLGHGRAHLSAFQRIDGSRVVAVCDLDRALAKRTAENYEVARIHHTLDDLLGDSTVDAVVIATPDHMHGQQAIAALEAGKHVLSEIPMALTLGECERIVDLERTTGLKYTMGNQVRFAWCLQDVKESVARGEFGEVLYGEGEYLHNMRDYLVETNRAPDHWRVDPSRPQTTLLGGGPHAIDTLRWLMGARFVEAQAMHADVSIEGWPGPHTTVAIFKANDGAAAKVTVGYGFSRPYCLYFSLYGSRGSFERERNQDLARDETTNYLSFAALPRARGMLPATVSMWTNPSVPLRETHGTMEVEQAMAFVRAVREDHSTPIPAIEAARSCAA